MYPSHASFDKLKLPPEIAAAPKSILSGSQGQVGAPTELLASFLSTIMNKDFHNALIFCKLIQQFEPTNATAKLFYPMILKKLRMTEESESESVEDEEEEVEVTVVELGNDSGIEKKKDDEESDESSSSDCDEQPEGEEQAQGVEPGDKAFLIEAQREIIKRLRSQVVPQKTCGIEKQFEKLKD